MQVQNLASRFRQIAQHNPNAKALLFINGDHATYGQVEERTRSIAGSLHELGIQAGDVVALCHDKSLDGICAMLALLHLGAAYVNLDDQTPRERVQQILRSANAKLLLSDRPVPNFSSPDWRSLRFDELARHDCADWPDAFAQRDLERLPAYIMFTSGSTGSPKGAIITHASVNRFIDWARDEFSIGGQDVLTSVNPLYFDNSVFDFYAALFNGAAMALFPREVVKQPGLLCQAVTRLGCTVWFSVPTLLIYLLSMRQLGASTWPTMRTIIFGGEGFPKPALQKLYQLFSNRCRLVNVYGPTECTCICSAHTISDEDFASLDGFVRLGKLTRDFELAVIGEEGRSANQDEIGELQLIGPQVGLGYINDDVRTRNAFDNTGSDKNPSARIYRTGDLVRRDVNGDLWFAGRKDYQIKHMGYRIELEEIDHALNLQPGVKRAAAVYVSGTGGAGRIHAFVETAEGAVLTEAGLRSGLEQRLPPYMIPAAIHMDRALPVNANGKIDRKALQQFCSGE